MAARPSAARRRRAGRGPAARGEGGASSSSQARNGSRKKPVCGWRPAVQAARGEAGRAGKQQDAGPMRGRTPAPERGKGEREEQVDCSSMPRLQVCSSGRSRQPGRNSRAAAEVDVRDRERGGEMPLSEVAELQRRHPGEAEGDQASSTTPAPAGCGGRGVRKSGRARSGPTAQIAQQDAGDQEAGDHEEDVDPEEAAGEGRGSRHGTACRQHRDGAQAVDIAPRAARRLVHAMLRGSVPGAPGGRWVTGRRGQRRSGGPPIGSVAASGEGCNVELPIAARGALGAGRSGRGVGPARTAIRASSS